MATTAAPEQHRSEPTEQHLRLLGALLEEAGDNGDQALAAALALGRLFGGLRQQSHFAIKTALGAFESGMSSSLVFNIRPQKKLVGHRCEARIVLGDACELVLDMRERVTDGD